MVNLPLKPFGRALADFGQLKLAEQKLLDKCRKGEAAIISEQRPEQADDNNTVRASFLRFLVLGGDEFAPVHERGVLLQGAWVENELNIESAFLPHGLGLWDCHLTNIILRHSNIHGCVGFQGCFVNGISADGMVCSGGVFLKDFTSTGPVRLLNTQIGGNLECHGSKFDVRNGDALICDRAVIQGSVFLNDSEKGSNKVRFIATGIVSFMAARIDGSLDCSNAIFNGTPCALECDRAVINGSVLLKNGFTATGSVCLAGTQIGGNLGFNDATLDGRHDDVALRVAGMKVVGAFHFSDMRSIKGIVSLSSAKVGRLIDDNESWANAELILDGFIYDKLTGKAPTDAKNRLAWLDKQLVSHAGLEGDGKDFKPQPWQQLQKVLREMGHVEDARQVAIAFEKRLLRANLIGQTPENWCKPTACVYRKISRGFHRLFGWLIGYGYRPLGLFFKMLVVWLLCGVFYWYVALYGDNGNGVFAPSNPLVFQNSEYDVCKADNEKAQAEMIKAAYGLPSVQGAGNWYLCKDLREEYTGFSPLAYSLDLILPLVDLQQEHDWAPMIPTPEATGIDELKARSLKHVTRLVVWIEILFGWVSSLLLVAVVSGLTKRREE